MKKILNSQIREETVYSFVCLGQFSEQKWFRKGRRITDDQRYTDQLISKEAKNISRTWINYKKPKILPRKLWK